MTKEEYFEHAVNAFGDDKLDEAIESYKKALEIDPSLIPVCPCSTSLKDGSKKPKRRAM